MEYEKRRKSKLIKITAVVVAAVFLWNQIVWAGDLGFGLGAGQSSTYETISEIGDLDNSNTRQSQMDSLISKKQDIENFVYKASQSEKIETMADGTEETFFSVETDNGAEIFYSEGKVDHVVETDGAVTDEIEVDDNGNLINCNILHPDGKEVKIRNGRVDSVKTSDGKTVEYDEAGRIKSIESATGEIETFKYFAYADGEIFATTVFDSSGSRHYDGQNNLTRIEYTTGKIVTYEDGAITEIVDETDVLYKYEIVEADGEKKSELREIEDKGNLYHVHNGKITAIRYLDKTYVENVKFDVDGKLIEGIIQIFSGKKYYIEEGRVSRIEDSENETEIIYEYELNDQNAVISCKTTITEKGTIREYTYRKESDGISIEEADKRYFYNEAWQLKKVETPNGVYAHEYYENTEFFTNTIFTATGGEIKEYAANRALKKIIDTNGAIYSYILDGENHGMLESLINEDGNVSIYEYEGYDDILEVSKSGSVPDKEIEVEGRYSWPKGYEMNPGDSFKFNFTLDESKTNSSVLFHAYQYDLDVKCIDFDFYISNARSYYRHYSYVVATDKKHSRMRNVARTVQKNTEYTMECVWGESEVNIYLYEASDPCFEYPVMTISDVEWIPRFSIKRENADIKIDKNSMAGHPFNSRDTHKYFDTWAKKGEEKTNITTFKFRDGEFNNKLDWSIYSSVQGEGKSISIINNGNKLEITQKSYFYNPNRTEIINIPIEFEIKKNVEYEILSEVKAGILRIFIYEKGKEKGECVYEPGKSDYAGYIIASGKNVKIDMEKIILKETYQYDKEDGRLNAIEEKLENETLVYEYAGEDLIRKILTLEDGTKETYNSSGQLIQTKTAFETIKYEYDANGKMSDISLEFSPDAEITYYEDGEFAGKPATAVSPGEKKCYYTYSRLEDTGEIVITRGNLYEGTNRYKNYYSCENIPRDENPHLKFNFKFDPQLLEGDRKKIIMKAGGCNFDLLRPIFLETTIRQDVVQIKKTIYDINTGEWCPEYTNLNLGLKENVEYTAEYVWGETDVETYIYESTESRPDNPVYKFADVGWDPNFYLFRKNADIELSEEAKNIFGPSKLKCRSTDEIMEFSGTFKYRTEFALDDELSDRDKQFVYNLRGNAQSEKKHVIISGDSDGLCISTFETIFGRDQGWTEKEILFNNIEPGKTYVVDTELEENNTLKIYVYEKGTLRGEATYIQEKFKLSPSIFCSIYEGTLNTEGYDNLTTLSPVKKEGKTRLFEKDAADWKQNKNILFDKRNDIIDETLRKSTAPLSFNTGKTDILTESEVNLDFEIELFTEICAKTGEIAEREECPVNISYDEKPGICPVTGTKLTLTLPDFGIDINQLYNTAQETLNNLLTGFGEVDLTDSGEYLWTLPSGEIRTYAKYPDQYLLTKIEETTGATIKYGYDDDGNLISKAKYTYYPSERMKTKKLLMDTENDPAGTIYEYSDDGLFRDGTDEEYGYLIEQTFPEENADGIKYKTFHDYYTPDQPRYTNEYNEDDVLLKSCEKDENENLLTVTEPEEFLKFIYNRDISGEITSYTKQWGNFQFQGNDIVYISEEYTSDWVRQSASGSMIDLLCKDFNRRFPGYEIDWDISSYGNAPFVDTVNKEGTIVCLSYVWQMSYNSAPWSRKPTAYVQKNPIYTIVRHESSDFARVEKVTYPDGSRDEYKYATDGNFCINDLLRIDRYSLSNDLSCQYIMDENHETQNILFYEEGEIAKLKIYDDGIKIEEIKRTNGVVEQYCDGYLDSLILPSGEVIDLSPFSGWLEITYSKDDEGSIETIRVDVGDTLLLKTLEYDAAGQLTQETSFDYYEISDLLETKTLRYSDENGNMRYEYYEEDFNARGYGRLSKIVHEDNSYEVLSAYWDDPFWKWNTEKIKVKEEYDPNDKKIRTFEYYFSDNLKSKTFPIPDANENIAYYYSDENIDGRGCGKLLKIIKSDYSEEHYLDGEIIYTLRYHDSGNVKSKTFPEPDEDDVISYEYYDEDFDGTGYGRRSKIIKSDGTSETFEYWGDTEKRKIHKWFDSDSNLEKTKEYYFSGNLKRLTLTTPDDLSNTQYEYKDENFYGDNTGRKSRIIKADKSSETYWRYWNDTAQVKIMVVFNEHGYYETEYHYDAAGEPIIGHEYDSFDPFHYSSNSWGQGYEDMWGWNKIRMPEAWSLSKGDDTVIAVLDTGIDYTHPEIASQLAYNTSEIPNNGIDDDNNGYIDDYLGWDFVGQDYLNPAEDNNVTDEDGHGTFVSGIIAAKNNSVGMAGVAPESKILPIKVLDDNGTGTFTTVYNGVKYALDMGAKIINMSLGALGTASTSLINLLTSAIEAGCIFIAAAGNESDNANKYMPAGMEGMVTVSATTNSNSFAWFSNYGTSVDVAAPGVDILSLRAAGTDNYGDGDHFIPNDETSAEYFWAKGTSASAPFVSGVAALMASQNKELTTYDFLRRLKFSSVDLGDAGKDDQFGWGLIDAFSALSYDWYESGNKKTEWLTSPDDNQFVRYDYLDETWQGENCGRIAKKTRQDGSFQTFEEYYTDVNQARYIREFDKDKNHIGTNEYDETGRLISIYYASYRIHKEFLPDDTEKEYLDEDWNNSGRGRLITVTISDGSYTKYENYFEGTNYARYHEKYDSGDNFLGKEEYDETDRLIFEYYASLKLYKEFLINGTEKEYLDEDWNNLGQGRLIKSTNKDGSYEEYKDYYEGTNQEKYTKRYTSGDVLYETEKYDIDGNLTEKTDHLKNLLYAYYIPSGRMRIKMDILPGILYEYSDEDWNGEIFGKLIRKISQDKSYKLFKNYYVDTRQAQCIEEYDAEDTWLKTSEYDEAGNIVKVNEPNGDVYTYYPGGRIHTRRSWDGTLLEYSDENWNGRTDRGKLIKETSPEGTYKIFEEYFSNTDIAGTIKEYDADVNLLAEYRYNSAGELLEKKIPVLDFKKGVNLPWMNYGYDLGKTPGSEFHIGFSNSGGEALAEKLASRKGDTVRLFLFCDLRSSINFDETGTPVSFTDLVFEDMEMLLNLAKKFDIKLIPVLFDFHIANNVSVEEYDGMLYEVGEHPDIITEISKKQSLLNIFSAFFDRFADNPNIYAWDIINEPEYACAVSMTKMKSFVSDFVQLIHSKASRAKVTVGSKDRKALVDNWTDVGLDIYQFHHYDKFDETLSLDYPCENLGLDKPVIVGEIEPSSISEKLDLLYDEGYSGGLFWEDEGDFTIDDADYQNIQNWFSGAIDTYEYYDSGRKYKELLDNGVIREFEDEAIYADGNGRLIKEINKDCTYKEYAYYDMSSFIKSIKLYLSNGNLYLEEEYSLLDTLSVLREYFENGLLKAIWNVDGSWAEYDETGIVTGKAEFKNGMLIVYDSHGNIVRTVLDDGTIYEYSDLSGTDPIKMIRADLTCVEYFYAQDGSLINYYECESDGDITIFDKNDNVVHSYIYNAANYETEQVSSQTAVSVTTELGDVITYDGGTIVSVKYAEDGSIISDIDLDSEDNLKSAVIKYADGSVSVVWEGALLQTVGSDGTFYRYRDGRIANDYSNAVGVTRYHYKEDADGNVISTEIINNEVNCLYDENGVPIRFRKSNGELTEYENARLKKIVTSGCNAYVYDHEGEAPASSTLMITGGTDNFIPKAIFYDDNGKISGITLIDGTKLSYEDSILMGITGLAETIDITDKSTFTFDDQLYKKQYDEKGDLEKIITSDNTNVYFDDDEISEIVSEDGTRILYTGGKISDLYNRREGAHYECDDEGRPLKVTYDNGIIYSYEYNDISDIVMEVTIKSSEDSTHHTVRRYENDYLVWQKTPSGVISSYTYEPNPDKENENRIHTICQTKNGKEIGRYAYEYSSNKTIVTDINNDKREYDIAGGIKFLYTSDGYVYRYHITEHNTLVEELIRHHHEEDNRIIYYKEGNVDRVETPEDGTILKDPVFDADGNLKNFTVVLPNGDTRLCTVYDNDWSEIVTPDGTKLIYKGNVLIAANLNHRLLIYNEEHKIPSYIPVDIIDDPDAFDHIDVVEGELTDYTRQKLLKDHGVIKKELIDMATIPGNTHWRSAIGEGTASTQGIAINSQGDPIILDADINSGSSSNKQGEAFLDLILDEEGCFARDRYNFDGKQLSFYVKLEEDKLPDGTELILQTYAKSEVNKIWRSMYSTEVTITRDDMWYRVNLDISKEKPIFGFIQSGFDPTQIRLVGIRIKAEDKEGVNQIYNGKVYVKDANYSTLPPGEKVRDFPFFINKKSVEPYIGVISDDQPVSGNPNYISWEDIPSIYYDENSGGSATDRIYLNNGAWRAQTYKYATGVETVKRESWYNWWKLSMNLKSGDEAKNCGEMFVDLRYDIPNYTWTGPIDLERRTLKFKVKAPTGLLAACDVPIWTQVFVKDAFGKHQYGKSVKIEKENEWITITLTPQSDEIEEGNSETSPGFDPTQIINIGIKFSCDKDSISTEYAGSMYVRNETSPDILKESTGINLIDGNALKQYAIDNNIVLTFEDYLGSQINLAKTCLPTYFKDDTYNMITEYYPTGAIRNVLKGNNRTESYDYDGKLTRISNKEGNSLVEYSYDKDGDLLEVDYSGVREDIKRSMEESRIQTQQEAARTIMEISEAADFSKDYVDEQIKPAIEVAEETHADLYKKWREWDRKEYSWWDKMMGKAKEKKQTMHALEDAMRTVEAQITELLNAAAELYAEIDNNVKQARDNIGIQLANTLDQIDAKEQESILHTFKQEVTEVVNVYYKDILGRNPSKAETERWITTAENAGCLNPSDRVPFDITLVKTALTTEAVYVNEAQNNDQFIENTITSIKNFLENFRDLSDTEKLNKLLTVLNLSGSDVCYDENDFDAILKWLSSNNKHFGRSAFLAVKQLFINNNLSCDLSDLAIKTILIDIFSGSIDALITDELALSAYALSKYAEDKGITAHNTMLNTDSLAALRYIIDGGKNAILHVQGNHFIVVESIDADGTVHYFETSQGTSGELTEMNEKDFLKVWTGYAMAQRAPPSDTISRVLSASEAMQIKGSDPFTVFALISIVCAIVSTVLSFIDNEICQLLSKIFAIVALVTGVLAIVVNFATIVQNLATGLTKIGENITRSFVSLGEIFKQGIQGFVSAAGSLIGKAVIGIALNSSYNRALVGFGVNANVACLTSAFMSGGFISAPTNAFSLAGGLNSLTIESSRFIGRELKMDAGIVNIIGLSAAAIASAGINGIQMPDPLNSNVILHFTGREAISYAIGNVILPNVASELAYYGIQKLGEVIGLSPYISYIAGISIRNSLQMGFSSGGGDPSAWLDGAILGATQGISQIGINYLMEELDLPPMLEQMGSQFLSSIANTLVPGIAGAISHAMGSFADNALTVDTKPSKDALKYWDDGVFNHDAYATDMANWSWENKGYQQMSKSFKEHIESGGLEQALNDYEEKLFNEQIRNTITNDGFTLGGYFDERLRNGNYNLGTWSDGTEYATVEVFDSENTRIAEAYFGDFDGTTWNNYLGNQEAGFVAFGDIFIDPYGDLKFMEGTFRETTDGYIVEQMFNNGSQGDVQIKDLKGNIIAKFDYNGEKYKFQNIKVDSLTDEKSIGFEIIDVISNVTGNSSITYGIKVGKLLIAEYGEAAMDWLCNFSFTFEAITDELSGTMHNKVTANMTPEMAKKFIDGYVEYRYIFDSIPPGTSMGNEYIDGAYTIFETVRGVMDTIIDDYYLENE